VVHEIERKGRSASFDFLFTRASLLLRRFRRQRLSLIQAIQTFRRLQHFTSGDRDARIYFRFESVILEVGSPWPLLILYPFEIRVSLRVRPDLTGAAPSLELHLLDLKQTIHDLLVDGGNIRSIGTGRAARM
jgi:hypothetical protein